MGTHFYVCDTTFVNILNLSSDVWILHVSAGEESMVHGQERHNGYLQILGVSWCCCYKVNQSRDMTTFSAKIVSARPPGTTFSESVMVGRIS